MNHWPPWYEPPDAFMVRLATAKADLERQRVRLATLARMAHENPEQEK